MKSIIGIGVVIAAVIIAIVSVATMNESEENDELAIRPIDTPELNDDSKDSILLNSNLDCLGTAQCYAGTVTKIVDGDTIHVDDQSIRFSLTSAPELKGYGGVEARNFIETLCPVGSQVTVDEDDGQLLGSYGRLVGVVYCGDVILNQEVLDAGLGYLEDRFCDSSEFATTTWAVKHGCGS